MTCIRATVVADDAVVTARQEIDDLAFAFVTPLEANDGGVRRYVVVWEAAQARSLAARLHGCCVFRSSFYAACWRGARWNGGSTDLAAKHESRVAVERPPPVVQVRRQPLENYAAGFCCCGAACGVDGVSARGIGMRMFDPQPRQRTSLPRALEGTASTRWHPRFGHMIRITSSPAIEKPPLAPATRRRGRIGRIGVCLESDRSIRAG